MTENKITVSVLIVTRDRADSLRGCLEALAGQSRACDEVVIIDNGSRDWTQAMAAAFDKRLRVRYFFAPVPSIPASRNLALAHARGEIGLFIDDDCLPARDWVDQACKAAGLLHDALAIQGRVSGEAEGVCALALRYNYESYFERCYFADTQPACMRYIWTANVAFFLARMKKEQLWFDEKVAFSEDRELGARISGRGLKIAYYPAMEVTHRYGGRSVASLCRAALSRARYRGRSGFSGEGPATILFLFADVVHKAVADKRLTLFVKLGVIGLNGMMYFCSVIGGVTGFFERSKRKAAHA